MRSDRPYSNSDGCLMRSGQNSMKSDRHSMKSAKHYIKFDGNSENSGRSGIL